MWQAPGSVDEYEHARVELDSHADTCAFGDCCLVLKDTGKVISVEGFNRKLGSIPDVSICTVAVAYDCPKTGKTYILLFHEALYIASLQFLDFSTVQG